MRNKFEERVAKQIPIGFSYETVKLPYTLSCNYLPDWINETTKEIIEAKGRFDADERRKMMAVKKAYPDYTITIVFQNPNIKITKNSKTTYAKWCENNGINWKTI